MEQVLLQAYGGTSAEHTTLISESVLARVHFLVSDAAGRRRRVVDVAEVERRLAGVSRWWVDDLRDALVAAEGEARGPGRCWPASARRSRPPTASTYGPQGRGQGHPPARGARRRRGHRDGAVPAGRGGSGRAAAEAVHRGRAGLAVGRAAPARAPRHAGDRRASVRAAARRRQPIAGSTTSGCGAQAGASLDSDEAPRRAPGHVRRAVAGRDRGRRLQPPRPAGGPDRPPGHRAAGLRQVPAPGRHDLQPALHRGHPGRPPGHRPQAARAVRPALRPRAPGRSTRPVGGARPGRRDPPRPRRGGQPRRGPHPARVPAPHRGDAADQRLPASTPTGAIGRGSASSSTRPRCPTCRCPGRCSRSGCTRRASRACTCAAGRWPAAACAGRTAWRTSAPRCSAS